MARDAPAPLHRRWRAAAAAIDAIDPVHLQGEVSGASGLAVQIAGLTGHLALGERLEMAGAHGGGGRPRSSASPAGGST